MNKNNIAITLAIVAIALGLACILTACGDATQPPQTNNPIEFCGPHGGVDEDTFEDDGDVSCNDGTEFESPGDEDSDGGAIFKPSKPKTSKLKATKPAVTPSYSAPKPKVSAPKTRTKKR